MKGFVENGLVKKEVEEFWEMIFKFVGYGFNKSYLIVYVLIVY